MVSLAESLLVAATGTAVGVFLAVWITDVLVSRAPSRVPRVEETYRVQAVVLLKADVVAVFAQPRWAPRSP